MALLACAFASAQQPRPVSREGLLEAIKIGGLTQKELANILVDRGVRFRLTPEIEQELRAAGASDTFIDVVRQGYRNEDGSTPAPPPNPPPPPRDPQGGVRLPGPSPATPGASPPPWEQPGPAMSKDQIVILLQSGMPSPHVARMVQVRGLSFAWQPEIAAEIQTAGGSPSFIEAMRKADSLNEPGSARPGSVPGSGPLTTETLLAQGYRPLPMRQALDYDPYANQGRIDLRLWVDHVQEVFIHGKTIVHKHLSNEPGRNAGTEYTQPIPEKPLRSFEVQKKKGRGKFVVMSKPIEKNGYRARIRIYDMKGGEGQYHLQIMWKH